ncbi:undecaprenyl-diphosphate phosphatase [bacterium]|uniref:Undecaprenyl-diphosphatase n=1 Tax=Candidatus Scatenecus faecavium TaxID=2840915 RepID=A0A9D1K4D4_9BACT|nr:undecaprenyl-diphosphate phosphatase [bacterium]HIS83436.1 undecaprenyl-diphosphate phosphatase [Candidatus Scatenecus faecavium]
MNLIQAILMGIVQGLSEFLPISSSAHLVFTSNFYKVFKGIEIVQHSNEEVFFDIMVHLGTLIAVLIFFRKDIAEILKAMWHALKTKDWSDKKAKLGLYIALGTVITVALALPIKDIAEKLVYSPSIVGILLFITGFVLLASEYMSKHFTAKRENVDIKTSILIGLAQGLAALPGFSRSGWTIATGLFFGLDRVTAARYSFLLSIPIILGASMVYPLVKIDIHEAMTYNWTAIIAGTIISGVVGYLCIKYFMKFISKFSLAIFGWYCILAGAGAFVFFKIYG